MQTALETDKYLTRKKLPKLTLVSGSILDEKIEKQYPEMKKGKTRTSSLCIGQTVPDMNAAARRAVAITPTAIAAAKAICNRSLMQREASHP